MSFTANAKGMLTTGHESGAAAVAILANFNELANRIAKCNYVATTPPSSGNDHTQGYYPGSLWLDTTGPKMYQCVADGVWDTYAPSSHTHTEADVAGLVADLASKASASSLTSHTSATAAHGATGSIVGTTNTQTLTNKTLTNPAISTPTITGAVSSVNGSWNIDGSGNASFNAEVDCGAIVNAGLLYSKSSFKIWNKAHNAWLDFAMRNETGSEVVYDFTNVGEIASSGQLTIGKSARTGVLNENASGTYNPNVDNANQFNLALMSSVTISAWSGTPVDGQGCLFKFLATGAGYTVSFDAGYWRTMIGVTIPSSPTSDVYVTAVYNAANSQFDIIGATGVA